MIMNQLYLMVGLPGSGKSTTAKALQASTGAVYINTDEIRTKMYGDPNILGGEEVFNAMIKEARRALSEKKSVILDATFLTARRRRGILSNLGREGKMANRVCIMMCTPIEECILRDSKRSRSVGKAVIDRMVRTFEMPYYHEGWDEIRLAYDVECHYPYPHEYADREKGYDQHNSHHSLTLDEHLKQAFLYAINSDFPYEVKQAAMWHDCGKPDTQYIDELDGEAHYYNHEHIGAYQFLASAASKYLDDIKRGYDVIKIAMLITSHMVPYHFKHDQCPYDALMAWGDKKGFRKADTDMIWKLHQCDVAAH